MYSDGHNGSSNPTSSASPTSTFAERDHGWSAWGPHAVGKRGCACLLQAFGERLHLGGEQVPVGVQGDARGRVFDMWASWAWTAFTLAP
jgi:hypothetical protein